MATTAAIIEDSAQADGRRYIRCRYDHDSGVSIVHSPVLVLAGTDAQAFFDARISKYDTLLKDSELEDVLSRFFDGEDMDDVFDSGVYNILTRNDIRRKCLRRAANRMVDVLNREIEDLANCSVWVNTLTNAVVAARLTNPNATWTSAEAATFKADLADLAASRAGLDHGKGEQDEDG